MQSRLRIALGVWFGMVVGMAGVPTGIMAEQVVFTIDPGLSSLSVSGDDVLRGTIVEQGLGSLSTPTTGHFLVDFDPLTSAPTSVTFVGGHGYIDLDVSGNWLPGPNVESNSGSLVTPGPADIGMQTFDGVSKAAVRNLVWDWSSASAIPVNAGDGSFDISQVGFQILGGLFEWINPDTAPGYGTDDYTGGTGQLEIAGTTTLVQTSPGNWTLTMGGKVTTLLDTDVMADQITVIYDNELVATAHFGADNVDTVTTGETSSSVLGGATTTGGVDASFADVSVSGTLSAQLIPTSGLSLGALQALETETNFKTAGDTPQIWDVSFDGSFTGPLTLTFGYDESLLGAVPEGSLFMWHFNETLGQWETIFGTVNTGSNTITITTNSLSPFVLGVPEPSSACLLALGAVCHGVFFWRRHRRRAAARPA